MRIDISFSLLNGGTQTPSEIMYAVVNYDPQSEEMTWVGTNNDGTSQSGTSLSGTVIVNIFGGAAPTVNASLEVGNLAKRELTLKQSAGSLNGTYTVTMWY